MPSGPSQVRSRGRHGVLLLQADGTLRVESSGPNADVLRRVARLHSECSGPFVKTIDSGEGWARFDAKGAVSLAEIIESILQGELPPLPYAVATAFIERLLSAVEAAHRNGVHFRTLGPGNVLYTSDGEMLFLGLGGLEISPLVYTATDVLLGANATINSDLFAALQMLRACLPAVDLPASLVRLYSGKPLPMEHHFWKQLIRFDRMLSRPSSGSRTISVAVLRKVYKSFWKLVGVSPDHEALRQYACGAYEKFAPYSTSVAYDDTRHCLNFADGRQLDLLKSPVQARLLAILVSSHVDTSCSGLTASELIVLLWPGERITPDSARNRLYVTISKLRKAGLGDSLRLDVEGRYQLAQELRIQTTALHDRV